MLWKVRIPGNRAAGNDGKGAILETQSKEGTTMMISSRIHGFAVTAVGICAMVAIPVPLVAQQVQQQAEQAQEEAQEARREAQNLREEAQEAEEEAQEAEQEAQEAEQEAQQARQEAQEARQQAQQAEQQAQRAEQRAERAEQQAEQAEQEAERVAQQLEQQAERAEQQAAQRAEQQARQAEQEAQRQARQTETQARRETEQARGEAERDIAAAELPEEIDEIEIVAPRIVRQTLPLGRGERVSMSARVRFGDLDLSRTDDVRQLESRISEAARDVCEQLAAAYPMGDPEPEVCARQATAEAMSQARTRIDAAVR